jgi:hypothetical protein
VRRRGTIGGPEPIAQGTILEASGYSPTWNVGTLRQIGVRDLLLKPITVLALSKTVRDALDGRGTP